MLELICSQHSLICAFAIVLNPLTSTLTPPSWPFIPRYGFQWSNISHFSSLLKIYAFEEFWYVFWIFQMQDILWIFDIRIWMIFIFTAMTKICDLLSSADCIDGEKWATFLFSPRPFVWYCNCFVLFFPPTQCKVLSLLYYYLLPLSWLLRNKMQISYGNR